MVHTKPVKLDINIMLIVKTRSQHTVDCEAWNVIVWAHTKLIKLDVGILWIVKHGVW